MRFNVMVFLTTLRTAESFSPRSRILSPPAQHYPYTRNRPLESAEMIAKAADEGPVEIVKEDGVKRKNRDNDDEPPTKKVKVGDTIDGHSYPRQNKTTEREELKSKDRSDYEETAKMVRLGESDVGHSDSGHEKSREREGENRDGRLKSFYKHERQRAELGLSAKKVRQQRWS